MLKEHLEDCREEADILDMREMQVFDSDEGNENDEEEYVDVTNYSPSGYFLMLFFSYDNFAFILNINQSVDIIKNYF